VPPEDVLPDCRALAASSLRRDPEAGPHVVTGPVAVEGAEPGDLLAVTVRSLGLRAGYGIVSNRHGKGALPGELPEGGAAVVSTFCPVVGDAGRWFGSITGAPRPDGTAPQVRFPLAPFLGITAVATDTDDEASSTPPGAHGGNLDIKHLVVGSTLYLPVQVPGALLSVGDPHYAQGNGEVALTALEAPLRAVLELRVVSGTATAAAAATTGFLAGPSAETDDAYIAIGLDTDLDEAVRKATRAALQIVEARTGLDRASAYAYLSAAVDFEVSQVVDGVKGIHAVIPKADLRP
jgi:acetamidase/formamidase